MTIMDYRPRIREDLSAISKLGGLSAPYLEEGAPAAILLTLLAVFERERISYCYWKSARRVDALLVGRSDLDLLVARSDRPRAFSILERVGFKHWPDAPGLDNPFLVSFLGYDEPSGAIHHVHLHFHVVFGHSLVKTFRLPVENALISRSEMHESLPIRILNPADEAMLLIVRANLDMRRDDPVVGRRWSELERKYADDLAFLVPRIDAAKVKNAAAEVFSPQLAERIVSQLRATSLRNYRLRRALARELSGFRSYRPLETVCRGAWRSLGMAVGVLNRRWVAAPRLPRRLTPGGGVVIAFVGVDGSGKSTQVAETRKWLGAEIDVVPLYFGSGDGTPSLLFRPFKSAARLVARTIRVKPKGASHGKISDRPPGPLYSALFIVWAMAVALDKRHKLASAQRAVARGLVVVADRYPQDENLEFNDGPLLQRVVRAPRWLRRQEDAIYASARRAPPDLVIKLLVGPEAVARREPDMNRDVMLKKLGWLDELKFEGARVVAIDGAQPLTEVTRIARRTIWDIL